VIWAANCDNPLAPGQQPTPFALSLSKGVAAG